MENEREQAPNGDGRAARKKYQRVPRLETAVKQARHLEIIIFEVRSFVHENPKSTLQGADVLCRLMRALHEIHSYEEIAHGATQRMAELEERLQQLLEQVETLRLRRAA